MIFKRAIQIPGRVSNSVFNLECVASCHKSTDGSIYYRLRTIFIKDNTQFANPTEWVCQDEIGLWHVLTDKEYKEWKQGK